MMTQKQANQVTSLICFDEYKLTGDIRDFDFNRVVKGLTYDELILKIKIVNPEWWKYAYLERH